MPGGRYAGERSRPPENPQNQLITETVIAVVIAQLDQYYTQIQEQNGADAPLKNMEKIEKDCRLILQTCLKQRLTISQAILYLKIHDMETKFVRKRTQVAIMLLYTARMLELVYPKDG